MAREGLRRAGQGCRAGPRGVDTGRSAEMSTEPDPWEQAPAFRHLGVMKALSGWGCCDFFLCVNQLISHIQRNHHLTKELFSI